MNSSKAATDVETVDLLLDTHIIVWLAIAPNRIPKQLLTVIENANRRLVSHVSALEIQLKHLKRADAFPFALEHLELAMKEFACTELPLTFGDIKTLAQSQSPQRDPFDRLLMAQAANRNIPLATLDRDILRDVREYKDFPVFSITE